MRSVQKLKRLDTYLLHTQREKIRAAKALLHNQAPETHISFYTPPNYKEGKLENGYLLGYEYHCKITEEGCSFWKEKCTFFIYPEFKTSSVIRSYEIRERDYRDALSRCELLLNGMEEAEDISELIKSILAEELNHKRERSKASLPLISLATK